MTFSNFARRSGSSFGGCHGAMGCEIDAAGVAGTAAVGGAAGERVAHAIAMNGNSTWLLRSTARTGVPTVWLVERCMVGICRIRQRDAIAANCRGTPRLAPL